MASTARCEPPRHSRRRFLAQSSCGLLATGGLITAGLVRPRRATAGANQLKITRIVVQEAPGRRATPVAPNAFAEYRGYEVTEPLVRLQTNQGLEGLTRRLNPERDRSQLQKLIGLNPFELFDWNGEYYAGPAEPYRQLLTAGGLGGIDLALFDLLGKALERPVADLFGPRVREALERDIAVFRAVRHAVGPHFTLFVDVNNGYRQDPAAGKRFIEETSDVQLFGKTSWKGCGPAGRGLEFQPVPVRHPRFPYDEGDNDHETKYQNRSHTTGSRRPGNLFECPCRRFRNN